MLEGMSATCRWLRVATKLYIRPCDHLQEIAIILIWTGAIGFLVGQPSCTIVTAYTCAITFISQTVG